MIRYFSEILETVVLNCSPDKILFSKSRKTFRPAHGTLWAKINVCHSPIRISRTSLKRIDGFLLSNV